VESNGICGKDSGTRYGQPNGVSTMLGRAPDSGLCQMFCHENSPMMAAWMLLGGGRFYHGNMTGRLVESR
jgi:hypothetical protein